LKRQFDLLTAATTIGLWRQSRQNTFEGGCPSVEAMTPNPSINTDWRDKAAPAGYIER
jgi:hypothetical protein